MEMNDMKKIISVCFLMAMSILLLAGCGSDSNVIVMATNAQFPPFEYKDGSEIVGIDVEIAKEIAKDLGKELKIDDMEFDSIITAVSSGKADMGIAGISINEDRLKNVDFSDTYFEATQVVIVKKGSNITVNDLDGLKIGVQSGTTGDDYVTENFPSTSPSRFSSAIDAVLTLTTDKIDAVIIDNFTAMALEKQNSDKITILEDKLTSEEYAIAVKKGNKKLLESINKTLARIKEDGTLDKFIDQFTSEQLYD